MFEDKFNSTLFTMQQWMELRNKHFYGLPHRENTSHPSMPCPLLQGGQGVEPHPVALCVSP